MTNYIYTIITCTNPELICSGSTFVQESASELLKINNGISHFITSNDTMDSELIRLSMKHPQETFSCESHCENDYYERVIYSYEYLNGTRKDVRIRPEYMFFWTSDCAIPNEEHYLAFRIHVLDYLNRLDIGREDEDGFFIDKLNDEKDSNGYQSSFTITWANDFYIWTAVKTGISYIRVSVKENLARINHRQQLDEIKKMEESGVSYGTSFSDIIDENLDHEIA